MEERPTTRTGCVTTVVTTSIPASSRRGEYERRLRQQVQSDVLHRHHLQRARRVWRTLPAVSPHHGSQQVHQRVISTKERKKTWTTSTPSTACSSP